MSNLKDTPAVRLSASLVFDSISGQARWARKLRGSGPVISLASRKQSLPCLMWHPDNANLSFGIPALPILGSSVISQGSTALRALHIITRLSNMKAALGVHESHVRRPTAVSQARLQTTPQEPAPSNCNGYVSRRRCTGGTGGTGGVILGIILKQARRWARLLPA